MTRYPNDFVSIQPHVGNDGYDIPWSNSRASFYGVGGIPATWFDGVIECEGAYTNDVQMFNWYKTQLTIRGGVATDVTIDLYGEETGTQAYEITAIVGIDAGGTGKTMKVQILQVLDHYPASSDDRYRNCVRDPLGATTVTLAPGESTVINHTLNLTGPDWTYRDDVQIVAFAQNPGPYGPQEMHQAAVMPYPFVSPAVDGDVDGDGDVDLADLSALLASYGLCDGDTGYNDDADFVDNDCIDLSDLAVLLGNYGYGT